MFRTGIFFYSNIELILLKMAHLFSSYFIVTNDEVLCILIDISKYFSMKSQGIDICSHL